MGTWPQGAKPEFVEEIDYSGGLAQKHISKIYIGKRNYYRLSEENIGFSTLVWVL